MKKPSKIDKNNILNMKSYKSVSGKIVEGISLEDLKEMHQKIAKEVDRLVAMKGNIPDHEYDTLSYIVEPHTNLTAYDIIINPCRSDQYYRELYQHTSYEKYGYQDWTDHIIRMGNADILNMAWKAVYACDRAYPYFEHDLVVAAKSGSKDTFLKSIEGMLFWSTLDPLMPVFIDDIIEYVKENNRIDIEYVRDLFDNYVNVVEDKKLYCGGIAIAKKEWNVETEIDDHEKHQIEYQKLRELFKI